MAEQELTRTREREPIPDSGYERALTWRKEAIERQYKAKIVVREEERDWEQTRQGRLKWFLNPFLHEDTVLLDRFFFLHDIRRMSGKHRHQGGLIIFIVTGKGYSTVDGERIDWEAGDMLLLPIKPGGVVHQHFNSEPGTPCLWLASINLPMFEWVATELVQSDISPDFGTGR